MKILIEVDITEAALNALAIIDQANQTDAPLHKQTDLDDRFSKNIRERLESAGLLDWEYDDFVKDCLYTISTMGYRTLSAAILAGQLASRTNDL